jgi:peptidoglycan biosynthesis protein MviN/MurJ (putative lipid II flippase)
MYFLRKRIGRIELRETIRSTALVLVASAALAIVAHEVWAAVDSALGRSTTDQILALVCGFGAGLATYVGVCLLLGVRELRPLLSVGGHDR